MSKRFSDESLYFFNRINDSRVLAGVKLFGEGAIPETIDVAVFREGKYKHYWYGMMDIDVPYLEGMIRNFDRNINPTDISVNVDHNPGNGAYGWVENQPGNLYIKQVTFDNVLGSHTKSVLFAKFKPNKKGREAIINEEFKYISAEINNNFKTPEVFNIMDAGEGQIEYGPTLTGFALTNRPFIPNMQTVFSEGQEHSVEEFKRVMSGDLDNDIGVFVSVKNIDGREFTSKQKKETQIESNGDNMKFSDYIAGYNAEKDTGKRLKFASDNISSLGDSDKEFAELLLSKDKETKMAEERSNRFASTIAANETKLSEYAAEKDELILKLARSTETEYNASIEARVSGLISEGYPVALCNKVKDICLSLSGDDRTKKFSVGDSEMSVIDIIAQVFSFLPDTVKVADSDGDATEVQFSETDPEPAEGGDSEFGKDYHDGVKLYADFTGQEVKDIHESFHLAIDSDGQIIPKHKRNKLKNGSK